MKSFYKVMAIIAACLLVLGVLLSGVAFACGVSAEATGGVIRLGRYIQIPVGWGHHDWQWDWDCLLYTSSSAPIPPAIERSARDSFITTIR